MQVLIDKMGYHVFNFGDCEVCVDQHSYGCI